MSRLTLLLAALLLAPSLTFAQSAAPLEGRLKKIQETRTIAVAYRQDALPFSFEEGGKPAGYTIDLCRGVIEQLIRLGSPRLRRSGAVQQVGGVVVNLTKL